LVKNLTYLYNLVIIVPVKLLLPSLFLLGSFVPPNAEEEELDLRLSDFLMLLAAEL